MARHRSVFFGLLLLLVAPAAFPASILIYGPSMRSDTPNEQTVAEGAGHTVTVLEEVAWSALTQPQFAAFDAIVFGDNGCGGDFATEFDAANDNKSVWSPVVTGNIVVHTFDVYAHESGNPEGNTLVENGIDFAAAAPGTGLYVSTGCYGDGEVDSTIAFLDQVAALGFTDDSGDDVAFVNSTHPVLSGLTEADLEDWGSSWHGLLMSFPSNFDVVATNDAGDALILAATASAALPAAIPSLSPGAMALLAGLLGMAAMIALRFR